MHPGVERERIRAHLSGVEQALRVRAVESEARSRNLDRLREYWQAGRFPRNHDAGERVPVFIDEHGGRCAVAELLVRDGQSTLAKRIAVKMKNFYLPDMIDDELASWIRTSGLSLEELAWIQPSYSPDWLDCGRSCPEVCMTQAREQNQHYEWDGKSLRAQPGLLPAPEKANPELLELAQAHSYEPFGNNWTEAWRSKDEGWIVGGNVALHVQGDKITPVRVPGVLTSVSGASADDVWFVGPSTIVHWNGAILEKFERDVTYGRQLVAVWSRARGDVWFGGNDFLGHWKDGEWTGQEVTQKQLRAFYGRASDDLWVVGADRPGEGENGTTLHWNGDEWRAFDTGSVVLDSPREGRKKGTVVFDATGCAKRGPDTPCEQRRKEACERAHMGKPPTGSGNVRPTPPYPRPSVPLLFVPVTEKDWIGPPTASTTSVPAPVPDDAGIVPPMPPSESARKGRLIGILLGIGGAVGTLLVVLLLSRRSR